MLTSDHPATGATEHGGIVFAPTWRPLRSIAPNARTQPLPWVDADVVVTASGSSQWRRAKAGEQGDIAILALPPYAALTVWSSKGFGEPSWCGDRERWQTYFQRGSEGEWLYIQGDTAVRYEDGTFTFHGRSDEVINVGGNRISTEAIENALLSYHDPSVACKSPVSNCVVVGFPHRVLGTVPCAFIVLPPGIKLSLEHQERLRARVVADCGSAAAPNSFAAVSQLPETHSGKYLRRLLRALLSGEQVGEVVAVLKNPSCLPELRATASYLRSGLATEGLSTPLSRLVTLEALEHDPSQVHTLLTMASPCRVDDGQQDEDELQVVPKSNYDSMELVQTKASLVGNGDESEIVTAHLHFVMILMVVFHHSMFAHGKLLQGASVELRRFSLWVDGLGALDISLCTFALLAGLRDRRLYAAGGTIRLDSLAALTWLFCFSYLPQFVFLVHNRFVLRQEDGHISSTHWPKMNFFRLADPSWFLFALLMWRGIA